MVVSRIRLPGFLWCCDLVYGDGVARLQGARFECCVQSFKLPILYIFRLLYLKRVPTSLSLVCLAACENVCSLETAQDRERKKKKKPNSSIFFFFFSVSFAFEVKRALVVQTQPKHHWEACTRGEPIIFGLSVIKHLLIYVDYFCSHLIVFLVCSNKQEQCQTGVQETIVFFTVNFGIW